MEHKYIDINITTEEQILARRITKYSVPANYFQIYSTILQYGKDLKTTLAYNLMIYFCTKMDGTSGYMVDEKFREEFSKEISSTFTEKTFFRALKELVDTNVLIKLSRGHYKANPEILWKGSPYVRGEHCRMLIEGGVNLKPVQYELPDNTINVIEDTFETYELK